MPTSKICPQCGAECGAEQRFCPNDGAPLQLVGGEDALLGQVLADRYQILSVLGEGGMGRVYLAEHVRMGRKSAVKVMSPNIALAPDAISRFNREAANASRINHPNVAQVYDFGETPEGLLYLAMEFVDGDTLRRVLDREGPLPPVRAAEITRQIAEALGAAHHLGIVHRDLKPDNVMLARYHDGSDLVKVVDFGIAKTVHGSGRDASQTLTTAGVSLGTPEYMSPEQLAGERLDGRTDIYSLGLLAFVMLAGEAPYPRVTSRETLVRRLTSKPLSLRDVAPNGTWSAALQAALDRALAADVNDRYASAAQFAADLVGATSSLTDDPDRTVPMRAPITRPVAAPTAPRQPTRRIQGGGTAPTATRAKPRGRRVVTTAVGLLLLTAAVAAAAYVTKHRAASAATSAEGVAAVHPSATAPSRTVASVDSTAPTVIDSTRVAPGDSTMAVAVDSNKAIAAATTQPVAPGSTEVAAARPATHHAPRSTHVAQAGDTARTAAPTPADSTTSLQSLAQDVGTRLRRAKQDIASGDVWRTREEIRGLGPLVTTMRQQYGGTRDEMRVEQLMRMGGAQLLHTCQQAIDDPSTANRFPENFRCDQLIPQGMRGQNRYGRRGQGRDDGPGSRYP